MNLIKTIAGLAALTLAGTSAYAQTTTLSTLYLGGNGGFAGYTNQMDFTVTNPIRISAFELSAEVGTGTIDVYMTAAGGTYIGNEINPAVWTLVSSSASFVSNGPGVPTVATMNTPFVVTPGVYGVAIMFNGVGMSCTRGDGTNQSYSNADLQIDLGSLTSGLFSGLVFSPRVFNGGVTYTPSAGLFAEFSASPTVGVPPLAVTFTDSSFSSDPLGVATWAWDFDNDGIVDSNAQNPSNTYMGGTFSVALTVTDASNPSATETK
ncbi:MAG: PKD domain-containing protein, partial [bacterium]|nr:PKD domain-containing protein [bacterium]